MFNKNNRVDIKGEVISDKEVDTMYYIVATTRHLSTDSEKRAITNGFGHMNAVVKPEEIMTAKSKAKISEEILYVVDNSYTDVSNYTMLPMDSVNNVYIHLYVSDGLTGHEDYNVFHLEADKELKEVKVSSAIKTVSGNAFIHTIGADIVIGPDQHLTWMMRFKYKNHGGSSNFIWKM